MTLAQLDTKEALVAKLFEEGILLDPSVFDQLHEKDYARFFDLLVVAHKAKGPGADLTSEDIENVIHKLRKEQAEKAAQEQAQKLKGDTTKGTVVVTRDFEEYTKKRSLQDFVQHYNKRFQQVSQILRPRLNQAELFAINRLLNNNQQAAPIDKATIIGLVTDIDTTKNGHIILELEDPTGKIKVLCHKNNAEVHKLTQWVVFDEVIAVSGSLGDDIFFANDITFPDVPITHEVKKSPDEAHAIFLSDIHFGSEKFMHDEFFQFTQWVAGKSGTVEQRAIAKNLKYIFVVGDLIDGVGIFPGQENELEEKTIKEQYALAAKYFKMFPSHIQIIICPGNHDAVRLEEPQHKIAEEYAEELYKMPNVTMVGNPSIVTIHQSKEFSGFDVLLYHGFSYFYYLDKMGPLVDAGGVNRTDLCMQMLLQKRHLGPSHGSTLFIPDPRMDAHVIDKVPDIFASGHVHVPAASMYRGVTCVVGSCWDGVSEYALKNGTLPKPGRVPVLNLQTRDVKIFNFAKPDDFYIKQAHGH